MAFKKGQSGNPAGMPKGTKTPRSLSCRALRAEAEKYSEGALVVLNGICNAKPVDSEGNAVAVEVKAGDMRAAAKDIMEWAHGKPGPRVDDVGKPENWMAMSPDEQVAYAERQAQAWQEVAALAGARKAAG